MTKFQHMYHLVTLLLLKPSDGQAISADTYLANGGGGGGFPPPSRNLNHCLSDLLLVID